jgi:hypothetical protein
MSRGLLFSQMEPPLAWEADFHDWYESEHIPQRLAIPGFASASRYEALEGEPRYLACYFLDDLAALETPAYARLKADPGERTARMLANVSGFTRYICDEISDTGRSAAADAHLFVATFAVPADGDEEFEAWYEGEHVGLLMAVPGWLRVRRYRVRPQGREGGPWTHIALHEIADPAVLERPERAAARDTDRRRALTRHDWFAQTGRWLYRPIHHASAARAEAA